MLEARTKSVANGAPRFAAAADAGHDPERSDVADSYRNESLATLAHELRSPLAAIVYALETIPDSNGVNPIAQLACEVVERQARRAIRIVDDLFDLCAGSWAKLSLRKEYVELAEIVERAIESAEHLISERMHVLTISLPRPPVILRADPMRLEQVLTNLLANAAKFTDPGGHIRLSAVEEDGEVVLRVRDDGRGIEPDLLPRVFDLFLQGSDPTDRGPIGLGLGLALVKRLVELHEGSVAACSDGPGAGSEFTVRLPLPVRDLS